MVTPDSYATLVVIPTIGEYLAARGNTRLAYLSCIASYHLVDYIAVAEGYSGSQKTRAIIDKLSTYCDPAFRIVQGLCNGTKHAERGKGPSPGDETLVGPFAFGHGGYGIGRYGGPAGLIVPHNGANLYIDCAVQSLVLAMASLYPAHLGTADLTSFDEYTEKAHKEAWAVFIGGP